MARVRASRLDAERHRTRVDSRQRIPHVGGQVHLALVEKRDRHVELQGAGRRFMDRMFLTPCAMALATAILRSSAGSSDARAPTPTFGAAAFRGRDRKERPPRGAHQSSAWKARTDPSFAESRRPPRRALLHAPGRGHASTGRTRSRDTSAEILPHERLQRRRPSRIRSSRSLSTAATAASILARITGPLRRRLLRATRSLREAART